MIADPVFWVLVSFVIFVALVFRRASKALAAALDKRAVQIKADLDNARKLLVDAQALVSEQRARAEAAVKECADIIEFGRQEAERIREAAAKDIQDAIRRREAQAIDRIKQVEMSAVAEVRNQVVDVAITASRRVLAELNQAGGSDPLVDQAITGLPRQLH